ncbi:MAG TPA: methyl-accepting chemotaxis protein, partial [Rectinemataceae bacterium]|nr:methyl-accepting chemotaxis protein [Rectinemataceae bacterium]
MESALMSRLGVRFKLVLLAAVVLLSFLTLVFVSGRAFGQLSAALGEAHNVRLGLVRLSYEIEVQAYAAQLSLAKSINSGIRGTSLDELGKDLKQLETTIKTGKSLLSQLLAFPLSDEAERLASVALADSYTRYGDMVSQTLSMIRFDPAKAFRNAALLEDSENAFSDLEKSLTRLSAEATKGSEEGFLLARRQESASSAIVYAVAAVAMCLVGLVVLLTFRSITLPLGRLVSTVGRMGEGDLTTQTGVTGKDELGRIAGCVDNLVTDLRCLVATVKEKLAELDTTGQSLSSTMSETGASVIQINATIANTKGQLEEQSSAVGEVSAAIEELARSIEALSAMIQRQSETIAQSSAGMERMIAGIESMAEDAERAGEVSERSLAVSAEGKAKIDTVGESVGAIVRHSRNLSEAAALITEIAERTNLLAMNAAIEAAHAGESGRGFAVVADEIRKLAEQSTSQARDISRDLALVSEAIESVRAASGAAVDSFAEILRRSGELGGTVGTLRLAAKEQREGGQRVLGSLAEMRNITRQITNGAQEMTAGNSSILGQVERLKTANLVVVRNNEEVSGGTKEINEAVTATIDLSSR